jgi:2-polyprenyl-3-methyl-5-hydroxy-6-metoxy-1,4-benzoquinol methylase
MTDMPEYKQTLPEAYFNDVYQNNDDPWDFETSAYELNKYKTTINALIRDTYRNAFEIGCSIGVLSEMLAGRCEKLLSVDAAEAPLVKARKRLQSCGQVEFAKMAVPQAFPDQQFDLILMSEVGYYLSMPDLEILQEKILLHLQKEGQLLLVHWTPEVHDYPLTGDQVHESFISLSGTDKPLKQVFSLRDKTFRLDSFQRQ